MPQAVWHKEVRPAKQVTRGPLLASGWTGTPTIEPVAAGCVKRTSLDLAPDQS